MTQADIKPASPIIATSVYETRCAEYPFFGFEKVCIQQVGTAHLNIRRRYCESLTRPGVAGWLDTHQLRLLQPGMTETGLESNAHLAAAYDAQERARSTDDITEHIAHLVEALHHYVVLATESSTQDERRRHRANVRMVLGSLSTLDS